MFKKNFFVLISMLLLCPGCFNGSEKDAVKRTLLVQLIVDSTLLTSLREQTTDLVNDIVKKELELGEDTKYDIFFSPKKINRLTVYYVNDVNKKGEELLFSALEKSQKDWPNIQDITVEPGINFFGGPFGVDDELVVMIDDSDKELSLLNEKIKEVAHGADKQFKEKYEQDLYDIKKSERYDYVPHVGLGRIRSNLIKEHMKDQSKFDETFKCIQQLIKEALLKVVSKQVLKNQNNSVQEISVLDVKEQQYVKRLK